MWTLYLSFAILLALLSFLPLISHKHWIFRASDFGKIQVFLLLLLLFGLGFLLKEPPAGFFYTQAGILIIAAYHAFTLIKYTPLYPVKKPRPFANSSAEITLIAANVYQFNRDHGRFITLIQRHQPDMVLTMESNADWEQALRVLETDYPYQHKITLENTYGMHFYSKIKVEKAITHFFVADDIPSMEVHLEPDDQHRFIFFGVHPPPPSPTEEPNSKERDGDLLSVARRVRDFRKPTLIAGDFNNVAWSRSSVLFRKTSHTIDPRMGHGFVSTFHARYRLLRFPIDLLFHTEDVFIRKFSTLENFGSDHLPLYCRFLINLENKEQLEEVETATHEEHQEAGEMIREGRRENGDRDTVAEE